MFKNDQILYKDYSAHFMVMERSRDLKTHEVHYPVKRALSGGETDPAGMEIDLWVRSKEQNTKNFPPFETFFHFYCEEVTWRCSSAQEINAIKLSIEINRLWFIHNCFSILGYV